MDLERDAKETFDRWRWHPEAMVREEFAKSWAHAEPAPVFVKDGEPRQGGLW